MSETNGTKPTEIVTTGATPVVIPPVVELPPVRLLIGISILSYTHEFVQSFLKLWTMLCLLKNPGRQIEVCYAFAYRRPVHMAQEELAIQAVNTGCTHLLLMDDDIYDVTVEDIFKLINADKDVIGGVMFTSGFPHAMCAFRRYNIKERVADMPILDGPARLYEIAPDKRVGIVECDLIPFGCTLIKTSIFAEVEKPWFHCDTQAPTDSWFMDKILDQGIHPFVHFDVWLNHRGVTRVTQPHMVQMGMALAQGQPDKVLVISNEEMKRHMLVMDMKMKDSEALRSQTDAAKLTFVKVQ